MIRIAADLKEGGRISGANDLVRRKQGGMLASTRCNTYRPGGSSFRFVGKTSTSMPRGWIRGRSRDPERVGPRIIDQSVEAPRPDAVAATHFEEKDDRIVAGVQLPQLCRPFGWLPIGHARVVEALEDQHRRVGLGADVLIGRVGLDVQEIRAAISRI